MKNYAYKLITLFLFSFIIAGGFSCAGEKGDDDTDTIGNITEENALEKADEVIKELKDM